MKLADLEEWLNNSVTKDLLSIIKEHRDASQEILVKTILNQDSLSKVDMCTMSQYRGQIYAFNKLLDMKDFLEEKVERKRRDEDDSIGPEFNS